VNLNRIIEFSADPKIQNGRLSLLCSFNMQCSKLKALLNVLKFNTELKMVIKERESYGISRHFQQYFSYIVAMSFMGGGNWRKTPICRK